MSSYSRRKLDRTVSIGALSFPIAVLICLSIVFVGSTSPFSPFNLYFMKVDLSDFPQFDVSTARRAYVPGMEGSMEPGPKGHVVRSTIADAKQDASTAASTVVNQVSTHFDEMLKEIKPDIPEYYHVGLLSYCKGQDNILNSCSEPSTSFSFSLWDIFESLVGDAGGVTASDGGAYLTGNLNNSRAIICLYISGFVVAFIKLVLGIKRVYDPKGMVFPVVFSIVTTVLLTVASAWVICFYNFYAQHIEEVLGPYGAHASLGANTVAATCLAVFFSVGSICTDIWLICL